MRNPYYYAWMYCWFTACEDNRRQQQYVTYDEPQPQPQKFWSWKVFFAALFAFTVLPVLLFILFVFYCVLAG